MRDRHMEINAALFIGISGGWQVEIGERNLLRMLRREIPERLAYDGVVLHFKMVLIAENQHRSWRGPCIRWPRGLRRGAPIDILIALPILFAHSLLIEALRVHLVRHVNLILLILIVGAGIPPPVRINPSAKVGISEATAISIAETVVPEGTEAEAAVTIAKMVEPAPVEGPTHRGAARGCTPSETRTVARPAEGPPAGCMPAKATAMCGHSAVSTKRSMTAAEGAMSTAALRGKRYRSCQEQEEE